jgi:magnesium chelatase family protein
LDRLDLTIEVPALSASDLTLPPTSERSADVAVRVAAARQFQRERVERLRSRQNAPLLPVPRCNAELDGRWLEEIAASEHEVAGDVGSGTHSRHS